jgi:hypothetical protein
MPLMHIIGVDERIGRVTLRNAVVGSWLVVAAAGPAFAQGPALEGGATQIPPAPAAPEVMSRTDLRIGAAALSTSDPRFKWDAHFGGDVDVVDYVSGRVRVVADYQAMLGDEFRPFDPNQGNYVLEPSASLRVSGFEVAGVFHHESRHLSDRSKRFSVDWNVLGGRVLKRADAETTTVELEAGFGGVVKHTFTDYKWVGDADVLVRRRLSDRLAVYARGTAVVYGVDGTIARGNQTGGRGEIGVHMNGQAGAIELFAGAERMVDAYPIERAAEKWPFAGLRLISR